MNSRTSHRQRPPCGLDTAADGASHDRSRGATSVEYALIGSLIAAVVALTVGRLGDEVAALFEAVRWW